jgi:hypothetical protein
MELEANPDHLHFSTLFRPSQLIPRRSRAFGSTTRLRRPSPVDSSTNTSPALLKKWGVQQRVEREARSCRKKPNEMYETCARTDPTPFCRKLPAIIAFFCSMSYHPTLVKTAAWDSVPVDSNEGKYLRACGNSYPATPTSPCLSQKRAMQHRAERVCSTSYHPALVTAAAR